MTSWTKIPYLGRGKRPPHWLEMRVGKNKTSYRVRYRANDCTIVKTFPDTITKWEDAFSKAEKMIAEARFGPRKKIKNFVLCSDLCDEILELKKSKSIGTYNNTENYFRVHIKPFLEIECPYASELNASVWIKYKNDYRVKFPKRPLFEHWKFFSQLYRYAAQKGIIVPIKLEFNEKKDDDRAIGQVIPDDHIQAFIKQANQIWKDRIVVQRLTGQRPGVIRALKKEYVNFENGIVSIPKEASKNRRAYQFKLPDIAIVVLKCRLPSAGPYFFSNRFNSNEPMDKHLKGWHLAWKRAGIDKKYTPHDIRHTFLTEKVNEAGINLSVLCYSCDLSIKELTRTYLHLKGEDTQSIAELSNTKAITIFGGLL